MAYVVENKQESSTRHMQWMLRVRSASQGQPTFVFFPHAGATPLSVGRLATALPRSVGVAVANLPRGGDLDDGTPPCSVDDAARGIALGLTALFNAAAVDPDRLVLVGNSYGALLAYETAWRLTQATVNPERLIVSGFRSPMLPMADTPLYRLPSLQLRAELRARFGAVADAASTPWEGGLAEQALRADLQACDTYRHRHLEPLSLPIDVLHLSDDLSVSIDELRAWASVTRLPLRLIPQAAGHFPWAEHPDAVAQTLLQLVTDQSR